MDSIAIASLGATEKTQDPAVGSTLDGRYTLRRIIANGGMGIVFEAEQILLRRTVAIKILTRESVRASDHRERLVREGRALAVAQHPGLVEILDAGVCKTFGPYLVLEMLDGRTLEGILASRRRLGIAEGVHVARQLCDTLAFAHSRGIVHRDIKPSNVFIARMRHGDEVAKVMDFGIAAFVGSHPPSEARRLTKANALLGTPEYMAPEQLLCESVDERADIYGTAVTLFEALTGEVPFSGTYPQILLQIGTNTAAPRVRVARPDAPEALAAVIARALATDPKNRFESIAAFGAALGNAIGPNAPRVPLLGDGSPAERAEAAQGLGQRQGDDVPSLEIIGAPPPPPPADSNVPQRRIARAPYVTPVAIVDAEGGVLEARSEDISVGGLLVVAARACAAGSAVRVRFAVPSTGKTVELRAVVRWTRPARGRTALGLQFLAVPGDAHLAIDAYVRAAGACGPR